MSEHRPMDSYNTPPSDDAAAHLSADTEAARLIEDSIGRLFATEVDKGLRERAEAGVLDARLWQQVLEGGFHLLLAPEAAGGFGQSWVEAFPMIRGLGYWQVPLPLAETLIAVQLATLAGIALPEAGEGPLTIIEQGQGNSLRVDDDGDAITLSGTAHGVPWARHARAALVSLADGRLGLLDLRAAPGVSLQPQVNLAGLPSDTLVLQHARLRSVVRSPWALPQPVWTLGALARSAMLVGALESVLEQAVRYAGERVQFGKPIAKNQAIQHSLALLAGDVAAARMAALVAAADALGGGSGKGSGSDGNGRGGTECHAARFSTAVAKVRAGEAATRGAAIAHQVHGAIGFTHEHALHFATRRLWAWRAEFGGDAQWAEELGRAAIQARASGFWPGLTRRHF